MKRAVNYFDYAAATPLLPEVLVAMRPYLTERFFNLSALYLSARANRQALESARQTITQNLGVKPTEFIFTAGGTEANNLAIKGIMDNHPGGNVIVSSIEHESVLVPASNYDCYQAAVDKTGFVKLTDLTQKIDDQTVLISIMYANNEIGTIEPLKAIAQIVKNINISRQQRGIKKPLLLHSDACQALNYLDMQVAHLGVDLMTINAGKIYGPKQCGGLYVKSGVILKSQIDGGGQESGLRSGTQNLANIIGFAAAVQAIRQNYQAEGRRIAAIRDDFVKTLQAKISGLIINGPVSQGRLANNANLSFIGQDNERLMMMLDEMGYQVATGSACSASSNQPSHVLAAISQSLSSAKGSLRISFGRYSSEQSAKELAQAIIKVVA